MSWLSPPCSLRHSSDIESSSYWLLTAILGHWAAYHRHCLKLHFIYLCRTYHLHILALNSLPLVWLWLGLHEWTCFYHHSAIHEQSRIGPNVTVVCSTNHQLILWQINSGEPFPASRYESTTGNRTSSLTLPLEGTTVIRCFGKTASVGAQEANITLEPEGNKLLCCHNVKGQVVNPYWEPCKIVDMHGFLSFFGSNLEVSAVVHATCMWLKNQVDKHGCGLGQGISMLDWPAAPSTTTSPSFWVL